MIFIVKDEHDEARDRVRFFFPLSFCVLILAHSFISIAQTIARHIMNLHMNRVAANAEASGEIPLETMKRYIAYCKSYVLSLAYSHLMWAPNVNERGNNN
jgi:DNA replication licensing factor MCM5